MKLKASTLKSEWFGLIVSTRSVICSNGELM